MTFKSVLVVVTTPSLAEAAINAGAQIALANDGHLDVLALGVDHLQLGYSYIGAGAILSEMALSHAQEDATAVGVAVQAALAEQDPALRWSMDTVVAEMGGLSQVVGTAASFADLVVLSKPYGAGQNVDAEAVVESALFDGHAPVLIIPDGADLSRIANPSRIVIGWNRSDEALAAAKRAMPFLKGAKVVDVTVVDPPTRGSERSDPGGMLCQYLVRHGAKASVTVLARSQDKVADVLSEHAMDAGADLLVMGAYGHSRLRESILGGATRAMLESAKIPVLMAR